MTDRADHLIERAAALLKSGPPLPRSPEPQPGPVPKAMPPPGVPAFTPPKFVPPPRPVPLVGGSPIGPAKPVSSALIKGGRVADLRASSAHPWIELAVLERAGLMVARGARTRTTEEYRIVISRVLRALHEEPDPDLLPTSDGAANVVMVTSARPGEGKSFTALNLSGSIAQNAGESVLLVDVDAKHNSVSDLLGLADHRGFLDLVAEPDLPIEDLIVPSELPNLSILPIGNRTSDRDDEDDVAPEERRLAVPIQRIADRFPNSIIMLDAPPCLSTSDPHTLAPAVGQVLMVVEAERTQRNEVEAALDLVRVCPIVTMLLNKVKMNSGHTFGSYDYFGSYT